METNLIRGLAMVMILLAGGCATPTMEEGVAPEFAEEGLHKVKSTGFEAVWGRPGANLPAYGTVSFAPLDLSRLVITQTPVSGTNRRDWQMTPEREQALMKAWSEASGRAFADYPREGDPGQLAVEASLTRVHPTRATSSSTSRAGTAHYGSSDVVDISVEFRLRDAASGDLLAVIQDRQTIASLQWTRAAGADMTDQFNRWAGLLHTRISGR